MMSLRDKEALYSTKEEDDATNTSTMAPSSSSRQWSSGLKNPRIVRVSRTFGGKDRHSKVCTIKGLRDRRIRLSVPTAIQLYDLQDRLGLGQPSKVIDWLLNTTKLDIDKLPPLPPIPGTFDPFQQSIHMSQGYGASQSSLNPFFDANLISSRRGGGININSECVYINEDPSIVAKLKYWDSNATIRSKQKEIDDDQGTIGEGSSGNNQVLAQNFFPIASSNNNNASILPPSTFLSNHHHHPMYNYYHHWEPSNLSLTQFGNHGLLSSQNAHHHSSNSSSLSSPLALSSGSSQLFLSPSMASASTHYPHNHASYVSNHPQLENDIRQFNRSPLSSNNNNNNPFTSIPHYNTSSSDLGLKPFPLSMSHHPQLHQSNDDDDHQQHDKNNHGSWKESSRN